MPHLVPAVLVLEGVKYCRGYSERPNNYGVFTFARGGAANGASGGFYYNNSPCTKKYSMSEAEAGVTGTELNFNATQCSSLYGGSSTVQPAGLYGLLLIRAYEV